MTVDRNPQFHASSALEQPLQQALTQGLAHHQAGRLQQAQALYQQVLQALPNHADANHNLGVLELQMNQAAAALSHLKKALDANPALGQYWLSYIAALSQAGQADAARQVLAQGRERGLQGEAVEALARRLGEPAPAGRPAQGQSAQAAPSAAEINQMLGLFNQGRYAELEPLARGLTVRYPQHGFTWKVLGVALKQLQKLGEALEAMQRAAALLPGDFEAHHNLGNALWQLGRHAQAEASYRRALELRSDVAETHSNLGSTLEEMGRLAEAEASYRQALALKPDYAEAHSNLGNVLQGLGRLTEAEASYRRALELRPELIEAHNNLSNILREQGRLSEAEASFRRALEIEPDFVSARWSRAMTFFAMGRLAEAWEDFDWRWQLPESAPLVRDYGKRKWAGEDLSGEGIVVWPEQGVGDEIEYAGVIPDLAARARRVVVECDPRLVGLFARSFPGVELVEKRDPPDARIMAEDLAWQVPMGGLLRWFRPTLGSFPRQGGYLKPDPQRAAHWRARVQALGGGLKVGIGWRSKLMTPKRAIHFSRLEEDWGELLRVGGVQFVNLQYDECRAELEQARAHYGVAIHAFDDLDLMQDLEGAAALTSVLDLVISPPTSVSILAGALGVPTWQLTTTGIVWEMLGTERMPFFPSMRVINRVHAETWKEVLGRVADELHFHCKQVLAQRGQSALQGEALSPPVPVGEPAAMLRPAQGQSSQAGPSATEITRMLGLFNQGRYVELEPLARGLTVRYPQHGFTWKLLGAVLRQMGRIENALKAMQRAAALLPEDFEAHYNLGNVLRKLDRLSDAERSYLRVLALKPDFAEAHCNLGATLEEMGRPLEAEASLRRALELKPDYAEAHSNLGNVLQGLGRLSEAEASYRRALQIRPDYAEALGNLGNALRGLGRVYEAEASLLRALALKPDFAEALDCLGGVLHEQGRLEESEVCTRRALELQPDNAAAHSNLLLTLNYRSDRSVQEMRAAYREYEERFGVPLRVNWRGHANTPEAGRRLKVGYVSADFRRHAVAYFIEPVLAEHDRERFEVHCYYNYAQRDEVTERIAGHAAGWVQCKGMTDEQLAERIRADGIDILVDLAGHTAGNRLLAFARKPAPVQMTYLGYPGSSGLAAMDYRLTDGYADPPGSETYYTEELLRLPECLCCYRPGEDMPEVTPLPAQQNGYITFGSFNAYNKVSPQCIQVWARLLQEVPESRLLLVTVPQGEPRRVLAERFASLGVAEHRLEFQGRFPGEQFYRMMQRADIALDPFPVTGGTTTCQTLWMGLPVVVLVGERYISRVGYSFLRAARLQEFAAETPEGYIEVAKHLAGDVPRLSELRAGLRARVAASALVDAPGFTRHLEQLYRRAWTRWCNDTGFR